MFSKFETKAALADTGLADNTDDATFTLDCIFQLKNESGKLAGATGKGA